MTKSATELQRAYYARSAAQYDDMHMEREHLLALHLLAGFIEAYDIRSVLDVGAGTGRAMGWLKQRFPQLLVKGVEPVESLRQQAYAKGISPEDLVAGDAYVLHHPDASFDLVCEFAMLHHVAEPGRAVMEMTRVASRMLCISDCNFLGQGPSLVRVLKHLIYLSGLWPLANWVKTRGRGYTYSEGDGIAYSYSVFQSLTALRRDWQDIRIIRTSDGSDGWWGMKLSAAHVMVVGTQRLESRR